jgi:acetyltransferase-like isoleucine patch superfamily enzyme
MSIVSFRAKVDLVRHEAKAHGRRAALRRAWRLLLEWVGSVVIRSSYPQVQWGTGVIVHGELELVGTGRVVIGDHCWFSNANGIRNHISTTNPEAIVVLGEGVVLGGVTIASTLSVRIGDRAMLGPCTIMDSDFHPTSASERVSGERSASGPVVIGEEVWIGRNAIILQGVTVGARAVIGAGAVVRASVGEGQIVVGNPQRVAGAVQSPEDKQA